MCFSFLQRKINQASGSLQKALAELYNYTCSGSSAAVHVALVIQSLTGNKKKVNYHDQELFFF